MAQEYLVMLTNDEQRFRFHGKMSNLKSINEITPSLSPRLHLSTLSHLAYRIHVVVYSCLKVSVKNCAQKPRALEYPPSPPKHSEVLIATTTF